MRVLITGAAGFIGHHVVERLLRFPSFRLTLLDRLDTAGNLNRLAEVGAAKNPQVKFQFHDLRAPINDLLCDQLGSFDFILHLAAGTHIDRSIANPMEFVLDNVVGTCNLLDFARKVGCGKFINFSTDEVFGSAKPGEAFKEDDRYRSCNPYSATKAGAEELGIAYHNTYGVPVVTTHCMNVIGIRQHPEKMVPKTIARIRDGDKVLVHATPDLVHPFSRCYIGAEQVADAVEFLLDKGRPGEKYNIVGEREMDNLELVGRIAHVMGAKLSHEMVDGNKYRPGADARYAMDGSKMAAMGWAPKVGIEKTIADITRWSLQNPRWLPRSV